MERSLSRRTIKNGGNRGHNECESFNSPLRIFGKDKINAKQAISNCGKSGDFIVSDRISGLCLAQTKTLQDDRLNQEVLRDLGLAQLQGSLKEKINNGLCLGVTHKEIQEESSPLIPPSFD